MGGRGMSGEFKRALTGTVSCLVITVMTAGSAIAEVDAITIINPGTSASQPTDDVGAISILLMDAILKDIGETNSLFGAMRLDDSCPDGCVLSVGGGLFGSARAASAAIDAESNWSGLGDGYAAIQNAVETYGNAFRSDAFKLIHFSSAENDVSNNTSNFTRQSLVSGISEGDVMAGLQSHDVRLMTWIDSPMESNGDQVVAIIATPNADTYTVARITDGGQVSYDLVSDVSGMFPNGKTAYTDLALESGGATLDRSALASLGVISAETNPMVRAFTDILDHASVNETAAAESAVEDSAAASTQVSTRTVVSTVSNRAASLARAVRMTGMGTEQEVSSLRAGTTGLAGGDGPAAWYAGRLGIWAEGSLTSYSDETSADNFWGHQYGFSAGADYRLADNALIGAGVGYENVTVDFKSDRERDVDYLSTTVYGAYLINDVLSVNALGSYGLGFNTIGEAQPLLRNSEHDHLSHRFITAANVAYNNVFGSVTTFGYAGLSYSHETFEDYEDSTGATVQPDDVDLAQAYLFGDVGYVVEAGDGALFEPFASARLEYDIARDGDGDRFGALVGGGVRALLDESVSLEAYGNTEVARSDASATAFGLNIRVQF